LEIFLCKALLQVLDLPGEYADAFQTWRRNATIEDKKPIIIQEGWSGDVKIQSLTTEQNQNQEKYEACIL
jgi:hypothetical protein